jgi:hypothetical protein
MRVPGIQVWYGSLRFQVEAGLGSFQFLHEQANAWVSKPMIANTTKNHAAMLRKNTENYVIGMILPENSPRHSDV